jgi:hypothetical protein
LTCPVADEQSQLGLRPAIEKFANQLHAKKARGASYKD